MADEARDPSLLVLVIEDNELNLELMQDVLTGAGYRVAGERAALPGIERARKEMPACILMDIALPDLSGLEAATRLKADPGTRAIPIIAVTAHAMRGDERRILGAGIDAYVSKPIDVRALPGVVARVIARGGGGTP